MDGEGETLNVKRWTVFHPVYINSKKTVAEGRRISLENACENPTCAEVADCCSHRRGSCFFSSFGCWWQINKVYPRDYMQIGRVRVLLKGEDGTLCNPAIYSRKQLMLRVAELVPRYPGRIKKQVPASASTSTAGPSKSRKGGRKKK